jgi:hypothetical protein
MLGLADWKISLAYILCILSTILCVVYGIMYWKRGLGTEPEEGGEYRHWVEEEEKLDETL